MQLVKAWDAIQQVFTQAQASTMHCSIASVNEQGQPHITPIGTVFLRDDQTGYFFDTYTKQFAENVKYNPKVCVMAVNASKGFWLKSLVLGKFATQPAIRLYGEISELRVAKKEEIAAVQKRIRPLKWTKGSRLIWSNFTHVRDIHFTEYRPIKYPNMLPDELE